MDLTIFLTENQYIDFSSPIIQDKAEELFRGIDDNVRKAEIAYEYVRDNVPHSFDINAQIITAKASEVLNHNTGICHAKANLLAALLRSQSIPTGFCFQHLTLSNDDSLGYCVHCYNAIFIDGRWIKVDARGNTNGINAQFSLTEPKLAFPKRNEFDEYFWNGIYANPHRDTMIMLEKATGLQDVIDNIPDYVTDSPDILELQKIDLDFTVCKIKNTENIDFSGEFVFLSKTDDEFSLVCESDCLPVDVIMAEPGWKALKVSGVLSFGMVGIIAKISGLFAENSLGVFVISTYNTDYIFLKSPDFEKGIQLLVNNGYTVVS